VLHATAGFAALPAMDPTRPRAPAPLRTHFELLRQLVIREIAESVKGSALGLVWLVLSPLLNMGLYVVVFGVLFGGRFGRIDNESPLGFAIGVYIGLTMVNLVNETIGKSTGNIQRNSNLVRKVVFPLELLPAVQVCGTLFKLLVNTALWLVMAAFLGTALSVQSLWLPLIVLPLVAMTLGIAWAVAALSVYFRDIQQLTSLFTQIVFWSSGVFYSSVKVMAVPQVWAFLKFNPVFLAIENIREIVLWGGTPNSTHLVYLWAVGISTLLAGGFLFRRLRPGFADFA
jgi:lipopolysaccharide transport system permease protein